MTGTCFNDEKDFCDAQNDINIGERHNTTISLALSSTEDVEKEGIGTLLLTNTTNSLITNEYVWQAPGRLFEQQPTSRIDFNLGPNHRLSGSVSSLFTFRDPDSNNARGENPRVTRVDVIVGDIQGPAADPTLDRNPTTRVLATLPWLCRA